MIFLDNVAKYISFAIVAFLIFLFYTRPEHDLTPEKFLSVMKNHSYNSFYTKKAVNADLSYMSKGISNTRVYYHHFSNEDACREYYQSLTIDSKGKSMRHLYRDQRISKVASERLTYEEDDTLFAFLYTKSAVVHSETSVGNKAELINLFKDLDQKEKLTSEQLIEYYKEYFKNLSTRTNTNTNVIR